MRKTKSELILELLKKTARTTSDILDVFAGGQTYYNLKRKAFYPTLPELQRKKQSRQGPGHSKRANHNFYALLTHLRKQGFIKKEKKNNEDYWAITNFGKEKLKKIKENVQLPGTFYKKEKGRGLNMIVFDIPEIYKAKRNWLRGVLLGLEFTMLQKSVWAGKNKLPEEFLKDLNRLDLMDFVHIFEVSKIGTIDMKGKGR